MFALPAQALNVPPAPTQPVTDYAHALSADALARLNQQALSYEPGSTRKIVVAIFPSLEGESVEDFTIRLAEAWKIGSKKNADGVIVAVFLAEHKIRIEVGYGLEGQLTDLQSQHIIDQLIAPRFRAGDVEGGLRAGIAAIDTATGGHAHAEARPIANAPSSNDSGGAFPVGLIVLIFVFVLVVAIRNRGGGGGGGGFWFGGGGGGWSGGSSGWSSGGGGGWSGGGGGSFGGGGATGSW